MAHDTIKKSVLVNGEDIFFLKSSIKLLEQENKQLTHTIMFLQESIADLIDITKEINAQQKIHDKKIKQLEARK